MSLTCTPRADRATRRRPGRRTFDRSALARLALPWLVPALGIVAWQAAPDLGWLPPDSCPRR